MSVTLERAFGVSLGFVREDMDIPDAQSDEAGNLGVALFHYRNADTPLYESPTRNGDAFVDMATLESYAGLLEIARQIADVGTFPVLSSLGPSGPSLRAVGGWLVFAGVNTASPVAGAVSQTEHDTGGSWSAPSLTPGGEAGDLCVSILATMHYTGGGEFGNASGATIAPASGGGRTLAFDRPFESAPGINEPRILVMTAPAGTEMAWNITDGQPAYTHYAFVVKAAAPPDEPSLSIDQQPTATQSGYLIDPAPVVHVLDAEGALDTSYTGDVTASLLGSGGVLLGTLTVAAVAGVATFSNLRPCEAGSYQLRFSATGYANLDSAVFAVTAGEGNTVIVHQEAPMRPIRRNEPTAEQRDIPLVILADDGSPWDGDPDDGGGLKAWLSVNFGTETPSPANIVKLAPGDFRVRPTDAYTDIAEGSIIKARVPAAAGRRQAFGYAHIIPADTYVSADAARKALVDAVIIASDGGNGYDVVKQPESNQIQRTIPDVGVITITATFSPSVPGIVSAGGS